MTKLSGVDSREVDEDVRGPLLKDILRWIDD
jgi:hypothetical protein